MIIDILKYTGRFFLLILLQVLILNNIQLSGYINPYLYILFVLMLPIQSPIWLVLTASFLLGLTMDMFSNSGGIHAASCVLIGFVRKPILTFFSPRDGFDFGSVPSLDYLGTASYLYYTLILTSIHHFIFFFLEEFSFNEFFSTFFRAMFSIVFTMLLILLSQYIAIRKNYKA